MVGTQNVLDWSAIMTLVEEPTISCPEIEVSFEMHPAVVQVAETPFGITRFPSIIAEDDAKKFIPCRLVMEEEAEEINPPLRVFTTDVVAEKEPNVPVIIVSVDAVPPVSNLSVFKFVKLVFITEREADKVSVPAIVVIVLPKVCLLVTSKTFKTLRGT